MKTAKYDTCGLESISYEQKSNIYVILSPFTQVGVSVKKRLSGIGKFIGSTQNFNRKNLKCVLVVESRFIFSSRTKLNKSK